MKEIIKYSLPINNPKNWKMNANAAMKRYFDNYFSLENEAIFGNDEKKMYKHDCFRNIIINKRKSVTQEGITIIWNYNIFENE